MSLFLEQPSWAVPSYLSAYPDWLSDYCLASSSSSTYTAYHSDLFTSPTPGHCTSMPPNRRRAGPPDHRRRALRAATGHVDANQQPEDTHDDEHTAPAIPEAPNASNEQQAALAAAEPGEHNAVTRSEHSHEQSAVIRPEHLHEQGTVTRSEQRTPHVIVLTPRPDDYFSNRLVTEFFKQLTVRSSEQAFLPPHEYTHAYAQHRNLDLASYFWQQAGPNPRGLDSKVCCSWRFLAGSALSVLYDEYPNDSPVRFTKQDRSEWKKVSLFMSRVVENLAPRIGSQAWLMLDTIARSCRNLRKMSKNRLDAELHMVVSKVLATPMPNVQLVTNSMHALRVLEDLTGWSRQRIWTQMITKAQSESRSRASPQRQRHVQAESAASPGASSSTASTTSPQVTTTSSQSSRTNVETWSSFGSNADNAMHVSRLYQANHPQANHPQANHPQASHPQASHPQANYPQANYPQANYPQATYPQASHPQQGGHRDASAGFRQWQPNHGFVESSVDASDVDNSAMDANAEEEQEQMDFDEQGYNDQWQGNWGWGGGNFQ